MKAIRDAVWNCLRIPLPFSTPNPLLPTSMNLFPFQRPSPRASLYLIEIHCCPRRIPKTRQGHQTAAPVSRETNAQGFLDVAIVPFQLWWWQFPYNQWGRDGEGCISSPVPRRAFFYFSFLYSDEFFISTEGLGLIRYLNDFEQCCFFNS